MNVLVHFHFRNQNITSRLIAKSVQGIKAMFQWFKIEKFIPLENTGFSGIFPIGIPDERVLLFLKSVVSRAGDVITVLNNTIRPLVSRTNAAAFPQISQHIRNSPDYEVKMYSPAEYPGSCEYKFVFECKSPAFLPQVNLLLNRWTLSGAAIYPLDYSKYVQIINPEYHSVFEAATLPQESLLLNRPALSGIALLSRQIYNLFHDYSVSGYKSPAILSQVSLLLNSRMIQDAASHGQEIYNASPQAETVKRQLADYSKYVQIINPEYHSVFETATLPQKSLLLNRWTAPWAALNPGGIFSASPHEETLNLHNTGYFNYPGNRSSYTFSASGYRLPTILPSVNLLLDSGMIRGAASYGQEIYDASPQAETVKRQPAGYGSHMQISDPTYQSEYNQSEYRSTSAFPQEFYNVPPQAVNLHFTGHSDHARIIDQKYHSVFERKSPAVIPQMSLLLGSAVQLHTSESLLNQGYRTAAFIKPFIKPDTQGYGTISLAPLKKQDTMKDNDHLYFQNNQKIEQAIEQVKKVAEEARQTAVDSISAHSSEEKDMRHKVDINRLSDEVYQLIDRRIKIERERRGYI
ncbi:MAG: hypothetical protein OIN66_03715 [Candidatus Methanoperedens sp.]|nr:hypothetical protein [Candidatus Methanoperedens sp.]